MLTSALRTLSKTTLTSFKLANPLIRARFSNQKPFETVSSSSLTTNEAISKNVGVNKFLTRVYTTTGLSFFGALGTSYTIMSVPALSMMMTPLAIGGIVASLVGILSTSYMKPTYVKEWEKIGPTEKIEYIRSVDSPLRKALFGLGVMGLGMSSTPLLALATAMSPTIVPTCLGLTGAIFGGASLVAYNMKKDSMLRYSGVLMGSLVGLIGLQLVGLASALVVGPNPFSLLLFNASNYIGIGLFSVFIAYDTHVSIKMYENGEPDQIGMATQFLLDIWNIFTDLLRIFTKTD